MAFLARFFEKNDYDVFRPNLPTAFSTLEQCTERLEKKLRPMLLDGQRLHFVGHSMGGLIIRQLLARNEIAGLGRCVLIGTPNNGTDLAIIADKYCQPALKIFKPVPSFLPDRLTIAPPRNLPQPEIGVIAGNSSTIVLGHFVAKPSDGRVPVDSVRFAGMKEFVVVPYNHLQIHHRMPVAELVLRFIRSGSFADSLQ